MKTFKVVVVFVFYLIGCFVSAANPKCSDHPIFNMAKPLLTRSVKGHSLASRTMQDFFDEFAKATPSQKTAEELVSCRQFAGQQTCCSQNMVEFLEKAASYSGALIQRAGTPIDQLVTLFKKVMKEKSCSTTLESKSIYDIVNDPNNTELKKYYDAVRETKLKYSQKMAMIHRGAMCAVCAGVDTVSDYMSNGKVKVDGESLEAVLKDTDAIWDEMTDIYLDMESYTDTVTQLFDNYADSVCKQDADMPVIKAMIFPFMYLPFQRVDPAEDSKLRCTGKVLFNENPLCENAQSKVYLLDEFIEAYTKDFDPDAPQARRNLAVDDEDVIIAGTGEKGIDINLSNYQDGLIAVNGDFNGVFNDSSNSSNSKTSLERLQFIGSLIILVFFAI